MVRVLLIAIACAACTDDTLDAPDDCAPDELHIIHGSLDERMTLASHAFFNKIGADPGMLLVGPSGNGDAVVHIEFNKLAARGDTVDARGRVTLSTGLSIGNCNTGGYPGRIHVAENIWRWELVDLAEDPYCGGTAVSASVRGCYRSE